MAKVKLPKNQKTENTAVINVYSLSARNAKANLIVLMRKKLTFSECGLTQDLRIVGTNPEISTVIRRITDISGCLANNQSINASNANNRNMISDLVISVFSLDRSASTNTTNAHIPPASNTNAPDPAPFVI